MYDLSKWTWPVNSTHPLRHHSSLYICLPVGLHLSACMSGLVTILLPVSLFTAVSLSVVDYISRHVRHSDCDVFRLSRGGALSIHQTASIALCHDFCGITKIRKECDKGGCGRVGRVRRWEDDRVFKGMKDYRIVNSSKGLRWRGNRRRGPCKTIFGRIPSPKSLPLYPPSATRLVFIPCNCRATTSSTSHLLLVLLIFHLKPGNTIASCTLLSNSDNVTLAYDV